MAKIKTRPGVLGQISSAVSKARRNRGSRLSIFCDTEFEYNLGCMGPFLTSPSRKKTHTYTQGGVSESV